MELKSGMICEHRDGRTSLVVKDNCYGEDALVFTSDNWTDLTQFNDNLEWVFMSRDEESEYLDIMKVYKPKFPAKFLSRETKDMELVWSRKTIVKIDETIEYSNMEELGNEIHRIVSKIIK